ncbi:hypothetical protein EB118_13480 [bacterium]|nr:hypothetical protein [bacterium]NDC94601.1 hypothetical protein [bacterium]NDD84827.1 hypothetical protein [bacterium]NDG31064.1 hypothetical protein [bacterium]
MCPVYITQYKTRGTHYTVQNERYTLHSTKQKVHITQYKTKGTHMSIRMRTRAVTTYNSMQPTVLQWMLTTSQRTPPAHVLIPAY